MVKDTLYLYISRNCLSFINFRYHLYIYNQRFETTSQLQILPLQNLYFLQKSQKFKANHKHKKINHKSYERFIHVIKEIALESLKILLCVPWLVIKKHNEWTSHWWKISHNIPSLLSKYKLSNASMKTNKHFKSL